jgi:hypothetical protein
MSNLKFLSTAVAVAIVALGAVSMSATPSDAKNGGGSDRFRCDAKGAGETGFHAKYEERLKKSTLRKKFGVEFEANQGGAFVAGQSVVFSVDSVAVGTVPLKLVAKGELEAELELDSQKKAFPSGFPVVQTGSLVEAAINGSVVLGCELSPD